MLRAGQKRFPRYLAGSAASKWNDAAAWFSQANFGADAVLAWAWAPRELW